VHNCATAVVVVMRGLHFIYLSVYRLLSAVWATSDWC